MEISRTKLALIVTGSVIVGMAIVIVAATAYLFAMARTGGTVTLGGASDSAQQVAQAPFEARPVGFLDSTQVYWGGLSMSHNLPELATGSAKIAGSAKVDGRPLAGLRLRLTLNGQAKSAWAVTNDQGRYEVLVPPGKYVVDGYELDRDVANRILSGKILHPGCRFVCRNEGAMNVSASNIGLGLDFDFVDPVQLLGPDGEVALGAELIARWKPYPGAVRYRVSVTEITSQSGVKNWNPVFAWKDRPEVSGESIDLVKVGLKPEVGRTYSLAVEALDAQGAALSETPSLAGDAPKFRITNRT